jgi:hypothetical protein
MKYIVFIGIFLAALLVMFIIKGIFIGIYFFTVVVKYMVIAGLIAGVVYLFNRRGKKDAE